MTADCAERNVPPLLHCRLGHRAVINVAVCFDRCIDASDRRLMRVRMRMCIVLREHSHNLVGLLRLGKLKHVDHAECSEILRADCGARIWQSWPIIEVWIKAKVI